MDFCDQNMLRLLTNLTFLFQAITIPLIQPLFFIELPKIYPKVEKKLRTEKVCVFITQQNKLEKKSSNGFMPKILNKYEWTKKIRIYCTSHTVHLENYKRFSSLAERFLSVPSYENSFHLML